MPNVMAALPNIGGALCSMPQYNLTNVVILRYFSEFGSFRGTLRKSGWRYTKLSAT